VLPDVFKIEVPLPGNPLKAVNSYVIKSGTRNLIVDTGMNRVECKEALQAGLDELAIDLTVTDLFITHMHADHSGLISQFATATSRVFCSQTDGDIINSHSGWQPMLEYAVLNGFPADEDPIAHHPGFKYGNAKTIDFNIVKDGDVIEVGGFSLRGVSTPGHTPGHMCLYETGRKFLLSGDHILSKITPNISLWSYDEDPLHEFLDSLDRVYAMDIALVLPAHRRLIPDHRARIEQLRHHHWNRADAIHAILKQEHPLNAYIIASRMNWDLSYEYWDQFPLPQKWFAMGEVLAHLKYLEQMGLVRMVHNGPYMEYTPA
jgi:glyoxylase-like metal-dependent hydrolase (beta-lactamase superfamily II)